MSLVGGGIEAEDERLDPDPVSDGNANGTGVCRLEPEGEDETGTRSAKRWELEDEAEELAIEIDPFIAVRLLFKGKAGGGANESPNDMEGE